MPFWTGEKKRNGCKGIRNGTMAAHYAFMIPDGGFDKSAEYSRAKEHGVLAIYRCEREERVI